MYFGTNGRKVIERALTGATRLASLTWPLAARVLPGTLEVDDNLSYWVTQTPDYQPGAPLREDIRVDVAIIGGGFTGVSTAYHLSRRFPGRRIALFEARSLANGASGRNGGMMLNWVTGITDLSPEMTTRIYQTTQAGMQTILEIIQRHNLPVDHRVDGTLTVYTDPKRAEAAHAEAEFHQSLGIPMTFFDGAAARARINLSGVYGAVLDPQSGQINGAQLVRAMRPLLIAQGVEVYENTPVLKLTEGASFRLQTPNADVTAGAVVLATNGYTGKLGYFRDALFPLHSHIFATAPLAPEQLEQLGWRAYAGYSDDLDRIAYSSLTSDRRVIFGGGSNAAYAYLFNDRTSFPGAPDSAARAFRHIEQTLYGYLPGAASIPITHRWTGTLGITLNRSPLIGVRGEHRNLYYAIGYCGHGVTLANLAGQIVTDLYAGDDGRWRGLPFVQPTYPSIPPEPFRWLGYQMFTRLTGHSPRV